MVILHSSNVRLLLRGLCSLHLLFHLDTLGGPSVPLLLNSKTGNRDDDDDASDYYYVPQGGAANFFLKATCEIVSFEIRQMTFFV